MANIATIEDLNQIKNEILAKVEELVHDKATPCDDTEGYFTSAKVMEILDICPRQWQNLRDQRRISFCQIGRKVYVKKRDLYAYIDSHKIDAYG